MNSFVSGEIASSRTGSYLTGRTRRSVPTPMFFIARTVPAMFTGSCGSYRTTAIFDRRESGIRDGEVEQPPTVGAVCPNIVGFPVGAGATVHAPPLGAPRRDLV